MRVERHFTFDGRATRPIGPIAPNPPRLGRILLDTGQITHAQLLRALNVQGTEDSLLGDILCAQGAITPDQLLDALAQQFGASRIAPETLRPDPRLIDALGAQRCLSLMCVPLRRTGAVTLVATARPASFEAARPELEAVLGPVAMGLVSERDVHDALLRTRRTRLRLWAESCVAPSESCRSLGGQGLRGAMWCGVGAVTGLLALAPSAMLLALTVLATVVLIMTSALRLMAAVAALTRSKPAPLRVPDPKTGEGRRPMISVLVPLYKEPETVPRLINRLSRLTWPRHLLDVLLVIEETDTATAQALATADLPAWMRVIPVPDARLRTKPRALNYAMLFARGSIIGVYDAEDAPDPDQLHRVVACFQNGPAKLACVQGVLDFYNPLTNWMARCFTIEYATWFRVILPGLQRLGLAVPLGGTTLFFRRKILEELGGWDAHNVTEDADLGIRLARHGYHTQLLDTVTYEEANCRVIPWVKQRSRWLKGYAITWAVHMRDPARLWHDLGAWRFAGFQVLFLGTLVQFALAPLLWSFWLFLFGLDHPFLTGLTGTAFAAFMTVFLLAEGITLAVGFIALASRHHRPLRFWLPALHAYFPLAVLAVYKALWEVARAPFYWDKTTHGAHGTHLDACRVRLQS
jgi:cellulose synthase/poly-beta-1,6-N-acetylglucosamine synthase-like glycosyltransferase